MLGSAGSNRIRSALLQVIVNVIDHGMDAAAAVDAPRLHWEDGSVFTRAGDRRGGAGGGRLRARAASASATCSSAAARPSSATPTGALSGGGDPRRGGAVVVTQQ